MEAWFNLMQRMLTGGQPKYLNLLLDGAKALPGQIGLSRSGKPLGRPESVYPSGPWPQNEAFVIRGTR